MRIAVIGARGATPAHHGIQQALQEICPRLIRRGHEIDVFSERNGRALGGIEGVRMLQLPSMAFGTDEASAHALLSSLVTATRGYDVVNFWAAESSGLFNLAAKLGLHRTVVSVHGLDRPDHRRETPLMAPESVAARFADAITVVSRRLERHFRDTYGRETFYIPNGVAPSLARPAPDPLAPLGLEPDGYILFADRLVPGSGVLDAVAVANTTQAKCRLVIAETGDGDEEYRDRVRREADPARVLFVGRVPPPLLDALMAHATLFLMPSLADEAPPQLLLAMAHGRAVVVSDQPEHLDVVGGDGFSFTSGDAGDLRRVLVWLLNDPPVVEQMQRRAAATVASRYCWDRIAEAYELVYSSVL